MCPVEGPGRSATFDSLPAEIQTLIFASAGACLTTCKASAALARDARLTAQWLLQKHPSQPLEWAARHQLWGVCHQLLDTFSYQPRGQEWCSGLEYSAMCGGAALTSRLLQWSCQEQHHRCGVCGAVRRALITAAGSGHARVVSLLLSHPSCTAQDVRDAVCEAILHRQLEVLQLLVSRRPDAGDPQLAPSPMTIATMWGDTAAMEVLVQHGADVNGSEGSPWQCDEDGSPWKCPVYNAVRHGHTVTVAWLLQQGVTDEGRGLGLALKAATYKSDATLMRMLLSYSPTQAVIPRYGPSALLVAVELGHVAVAEELLKAGVPSSAQAIQHAMGLSSEEDVHKLLRNHFSRAEAYEQPPAILQAAIEHGHVEFAQLLKEAMDWREAEH